MASHESALKAHRQSLKNRDSNRQFRSRLRNALKAIRAAIDGNDLAGAKAAFAAMTGHGQGNSNASSPLAQIGKALQAGDLAGAQQAFAAMKQRRHHGGDASAAPAAPAPAAATATTGTKLNVVA